MEPISALVLGTIAVVDLTLLTLVRKRREHNIPKRKIDSRVEAAKKDIREASKKCKKDVNSVLKKQKRR